MKKFYMSSINVPADYECPIPDTFKAGDVLADSNGVVFFIAKRVFDKAVLYMIDKKGKLCEVQAVQFPECCMFTRYATDHEKLVIRNKMLEEGVFFKKEFLKNEDTKGICNCLICKNCQPPIYRDKGMCKLKECKFEEA